MVEVIKQAIPFVFLIGCLMIIIGILGAAIEALIRKVLK